MTRLIVCYRDKVNAQISCDTKKDFTEIRFRQGFDDFEILEVKFCSSKKQEREFEKKCKEKYK